MAYTNNSVHAYRETRVKTASQGRIIVMLYDEALRQIDEAVGLLDAGTKQLDRVNNSVVKAQDIITELMVSLDMEQGGDIARNLFRLYMFFNDRLMEGNVRKETKPLIEVRGLMANLRDAWREIENVATSAPAVTTGVNIAG
jgi:flagellar protein FliS